MKRASFALAAALAVLGLGASARADTNAATADKMFREAKRAMDAGDYPRACPLFEESQRLDPGGGTLMNLALCQEKLGKLATARKTFEEAASRARADGRADRLGEASAHVAALAPRVPTLTLVSARALGAIGKVSLDGRALRAEELNTKIPIDPGAHVVRIEPEGAAPSTLAADSKEGEDTRLSLDESGSEVLPSNPPKPAPVVPERPAPSWRPPPALEVPARRPESSFSTASWTAFGIAAAGGGTALVTGLMALSARSDYAEKCFDDRGYCTDTTARESGDRARQLAWVSTVSLGVGVAALWTGLLLPRSYAVSVTPQGAGLSLRTSF